MSGNPLTFSVVSGPSTVSIDPKSGVVTYTPAASGTGLVNVTFQAANPLGAVTQTIQFDVTAANPYLGKPVVSLYASTSTYNGQYQQVSAKVVGKDGVTPVAGSYVVAYNGGKSGYPQRAGTYQVLVTFTSNDPNYGDATLLTKFTVDKAVPSFSNLSSPTIAAGETVTTLSGSIGVGTAVPSGDYVTVTLNGVSQQATVDANGNFSSAFATGALPVGSDRVTFAFAGDSYFKAGRARGSVLKVIPTAAPAVTLNPTDATSSDGDGDGVSFTAGASGSPPPTVQWQVSTDGGLTFSDITSNSSATTTTLIFIVNSSENGYEYRAVFTNPYGTAVTSAAVLTVDSGG